MDWVIWTIAGIILIGLVIGVYRGALRIAVSAATAVLTIFIAVAVAPVVTDAVVKYTPLDESISEYVMKSMTKMTSSFLTESEEAVVELPRDVQMKAIEMSDFPDVFKRLLTENNNPEIYGELGVETFAQYVGTFLSRLVIRIAVFAILLLLVTIILRAIVFALNVIKKIPVFGFANRLAGGAIGMVCSLLVVWFLMLIVILMYSTDIGKQIHETILGNAYIRIIYENNPLFNLSIKF